MGIELLPNLIRLTNIPGGVWWMNVNLSLMTNMSTAQQHVVACTRVCVCVRDTKVCILAFTLSPPSV